MMELSKVYDSRVNTCNRVDWSEKHSEMEEKSLELFDPHQLGGMPPPILPGIINNMHYK